MLALVAVPASSASAAVTASLADGALTVVSTAEEENTILVDRDRAAAELVVTEGNGAVGTITAGPGCFAGALTPEGPTVRCPAGGVSRVDVRLGPGDDAFGDLGVDLPTSIRGEAGDDRIEAGDGNDVVDGGAGEDDLSGFDGDDTVIGGPAPDILQGGAGRDRLDGADSGLDRVLSCGDGDDDVDADPVDVRTDGCEAIAPELSSAPVLAAPGGWFVGSLIAPTFGYAILGDYPPTLQVQWESCVPGGACVLEPPVTEVGRSLAATEEGRTFAATVTLTNRAGSVTARTQTSPPIGPDPTATPVPPAPPALPPAQPVPATRAELEKTLRAALARGLAPLARTDPRTFARRRAARVSLTYPLLGRAELRWTVSASVARRNGLRPKNGKAVVVARASAAVRAADAPVRLTVRLTADGRRLLRRARRVAIDATTTLKPSAGPTSSTSPLTAKSRFTLRRR